MKAVSEPHFEYQGSLEAGPAYRQLAALRFVVAYLGERHLAAWWDTAFLSHTGLRYAEINFPRSAMAAAGVSASEAARRLHDARIGKGRVFHLFRLPPAIEEAVHFSMLHGEPKPIKTMIADRQSALGSLKAIAGGKKIKEAEGPLQVGSVADILTEDATTALAGYYLNGFLNEKKVFPYFLQGDF
jgi:hypothetical protein